MAKFNKVTNVNTRPAKSTKTEFKSKKTTNFSGGKAYTTSDEYELVSLLLTSFAEDKMFETKEAQFKRLDEVAQRLIDDGKSDFVARAALYARREFGMRSITHVLAAKIASAVSGAEWKRRFFAQFPYRVDDITETMAYYFQTYGYSKSDKYRSIPAAMKTGFAEALGRFDSYQLAKYRGEGGFVSLVDAVNLLHPKPTEKNADALRLLVNGNLKNTNTWESQLSKAGAEAENEEEFKDAKGDVFANLLREKRLGYLALIRNLRNILEAAPEMVDEVCEAIKNEKEIRKGLVFPFVYLGAFHALENVPDNNKFFAANRNKINDALSEALEISAKNMPVFYGNTLVALDDSGSMGGMYFGNTGRNAPTPGKIGGVFMAMIASRSPNTDLMMVSMDARYIRLKGNGILEQANNLKFDGGGTDIPKIFQRANKKYDRIIILSDMESWANYGYADRYLEDYKRKYDANPNIYAFDLAGTGKMLFPQENVYKIAGYSDKTLQFLGNREQDKDALINTIKAYGL